MIQNSRTAFSRLRQARFRDAAHAASVLPIELFFDLVYVLAITQITHHLLEHLTWRGSAESVILLLAVWLGWIHMTWLANYIDVGGRPARLIVILVMFASLISSSSLGEAFDGRALSFAAALVAILVVSTGWMMLACGRDHELFPTLGRAFIWWAATAFLWIGGALLDRDPRMVVWLATALLSFWGMWLGFPVPRLGHSHTTDYHIAGEHMAHRCFLFVTIALGESILITGSNFGDMPSTLERTAAFVAAFVGSVAFWWIYFDRAALAGAEVIRNADDPARLGLIAYTYIHVPIIFAVIVTAAADEIAIAHPGHEVSFAEAAAIVGGPMLYLVANSMFKLALWGHVPISRFAGITALAMLPALASMSSALVLGAAATAIVAAVALYDLLNESRYLAEHGITEAQITGATT